MKDECMKSLQNYLDRADALFKELIQVATQLRDDSRQVLSEAELAPLQKQQEQLLVQISEIDQEIQDYYAKELDPKVHEHWHNQIQLFKQLNQEFITNLNETHGLIQFDARTLKQRRSDEEDVSLPFTLSRLGKTFSHPEQSDKNQPKKPDKT